MIHEEDELKIYRSRFQIKITPKMLRKFISNPLNFTKWVLFCKEVDSLSELSKTQLLIQFKGQFDLLKFLPISY